MPSKSRAEQKMMAIAKHHPEQLYARNRGVLKMTQQQLHEFASGSMKGKPAHVKHAVDAGKSGRKHRFTGESHSYDFRTRNNLKRGKG